MDHVFGAICLILSIAVIQKLRKPHKKLKRLDEPTFWDYEVIKKLIIDNSIHLPATFVNLDAFDKNTKRITDIIRNSGKTLRIATKSIRCPYLIKRISSQGKDIVTGFMCYSVQEAVLLAKEGLDNFYIAYPTLQRIDIISTLGLLRQGSKITLTIDSVEGVVHLDSTCAKEQQQSDIELPLIGVCIDLDMSYKLFFGLIHIGAHRSQIDNVEKFADVAESVKKSDHLKLVAAMGYEAQVAGLPDDNPFAPFPNTIIRFMKALFYLNAVKFRHEIADYCRHNDLHLEFFNGGGSGNIEDACADTALTEVTVGSSFLQAQLFDYYVDNQCSPALVFALQATRINNRYIVCQSGGFIASGSTSGDKSPKPFNNPLNLEPFVDEGYGEVQTPLGIKGVNSSVKGEITLSDPVLFRPAKSGEIGEHFQVYHLIQNNELVGSVKTYRGLGEVFH